MLRRAIAGGAERAARRDCRENWRSRAAWNVKRDPKTLPDRRVIDLYFEDHDRESYITEECPLED